MDGPSHIQMWRWLCISCAGKGNQVNVAKEALSTFFVSLTSWYPVSFQRRVSSESPWQLPAYLHLILPDMRNIRQHGNWIQDAWGYKALHHIAFFPCLFGIYSLVVYQSNTLQNKLCKTWVTESPDILLCWSCTLVILEPGLHLMHLSTSR